jgi:hypothetical protein
MKSEEEEMNIGEDKKERRKLDQCIKGIFLCDRNIVDFRNKGILL